MRLAIRITEHYNTRPYEFKEIAVEVEDLVSSDLRELPELLDTADAAMRQGRERVLAMSTNSESMIHDHPALTGAS